MSAPTAGCSQPYHRTLRMLDAHHAKLLAAIRDTKQAYLLSLPNMSKEEFAFEFARRYSMPDLARAVEAEARRRKALP